MSGLEAAAAVAAIVGIVASPFFQTIFDSLKMRLTKSKPLQPPSSNHPNQLPQPNISSELLALEEAMGNIPLLIQLSKNIENSTGGTANFLTQLLDVAYAAEDLEDELEYEELQQNVLKMSTAGARAEASTSSTVAADSLNVVIDTEEGVDPAVMVGAESQPSDASCWNSLVSCLAKLIKFFTECFTWCCPASATAPPPSELPLPPASFQTQVPCSAPYELQHNFQSRITADRIKRVLEDLNGVASRLKEACTLVLTSPRTSMAGKGKTASMIPIHRVTTSTINSSIVYGRDEKKQQIKEILITRTQVSIIAIIGIGGVGKTTLAQYVFNDTDLHDCFDFKVWICVSDEYRKERVIKEIIIDTTSSEANTSLELKSTNMDTLENMLKENVKDRTVLLVLDDVWSDQWTEILLQLRASIKCIKIIVTSREKKNIKLPWEVAHCETEFIELEGLEEAEYLMLFNEHAFGNLPREGPLKEIGEQIAKKLKGSPLAAKTVGAVLRENAEIGRWNRVLDSELWNIENKEPGYIMPALMLSYLHLPAILQRCFSYCAIFPKDHDLDRESLTNMWIAQGYVSCKQDERLEDVGLQYFDDLMSRSFFTKSAEDSYKMHDLLHDLALFVSLKEFFVSHSGKWQGYPETCRHLTMCSRAGQLPQDLTHRLKEVRTLTTIGVRSIDNWEGASEMLKSLGKVRVMVLTQMTSMSLRNEFILQDIGHLIHLRYLNLSEIAISDVPESICSLYHLQTLLFDPYEKITFPEKMNNLINLRHLIADKTSITTISCIGNLSHLQELAAFNIKPGKQYDIGQLQEMNELGGELHICNMENVGAIDDAMKAKMEKKQRLKVLRFDWESATSAATRPVEHHHDSVLECLRPHHLLEELQISRHPGSKPPSWLERHSLRCIQRISLSGCLGWRSLPHIAELPHLKHLRMQEMNLVVELGEEVAFPSLLELELREVSLSFRKSRTAAARSQVIFPRLQEMELYDCKKLEGLVMPSSLQVLSVENSDLELPVCLKGLSSLTSLEIHNQENFMSFDAVVMDSLEHWRMQSVNLVVELGEEVPFPSLLELTLSNVSLSFRKSRTAAARSQVIFPRLEKMMLSDCNKLEGLVIPSSLQVLNVENCDPELPACLKGLSSLTSFHIYNQKTFMPFDAVVMDSLENWSMERVNLVVELGEEVPFPSLLELTWRDVSLSFRKSRTAAARSQVIFPRLENMKLYDCNKLEGLVMPSSLQVLAVENCDLELPACLKGLSSLTYLNIRSQENLMSFDAVVMDSLEEWIMERVNLVVELGEEVPFPSLLRLYLEEVSLSFRKSRTAAARSQVIFPRLREMNLYHCNKLEGLVMPSSLQDLTVENCDLELPAYLKGLSSLTSLTIWNQAYLMSFDAVVMDSLEDWRMERVKLVVELGEEVPFPSLLKLYLKEVSLSFRKSRTAAARSQVIFPRLQEMKLYRCYKLEGLVMPSSLQDLTVENCDLELPACLKGLSSLTSLTICKQENLISLDAVVMDSLEYWMMNRVNLVVELGEEVPFPSLLKLYLFDVSLSFRKSRTAAARSQVIFPRLREMELYSCKKLEGLVMPSSLQVLIVENCDFELPACLKGLSSLTSLKIRRQENFRSFDGEVMDSLAALNRLVIKKCVSFRSLPENGLPASLEELKIVECSQELHAQLKDHRSAEWLVVKKVPYKYISP